MHSPTLIDIEQTIVKVAAEHGAPPDTRIKKEVPKKKCKTLHGVACAKSTCRQVRQLRLHASAATGGETMDAADQCNANATYCV